MKRATTSGIRIRLVQALAYHGTPENLRYAALIPMRKPPSTTRAIYTGQRCSSK
jgi:hypothetical protein